MRGAFIATPHSSNVSGVAHDPELGGVVVSFKDGVSYLYKGAPATHVNALARDASPGRYVHTVLKKYPAEKL